MDARKVLMKTEKTYAVWRDALEKTDDQNYERAPAAGGWTLGQISDHVTLVSSAFLDAVEALARGEGEERRGSFLATLMCGVFGSFPPVRLKVPGNLPDEVKRAANPDSLPKAEALERFAVVMRRTRDLCEAVAAAPRGLRMQHPAAGWVNARQWYQLSEMHMRHHLRQLRRL
ncbi:MAG: DinB family protein [Planctomycetota bacterium]|jgi:hypothetical protein